jgi:LppP/LprE lipoprotein
MSMRVSRLIALLLLVGLVAAGCGWKPPGARPAEPDTCAATDGPSADTVTTAIGALPSQGGAPWRQTARGHTKDCRLYWVQVSTGTDATAPAQLLFFNRDTPLGTATPNPRPYTSVTTSGHDTVTVQYQWRQDGEQPCCPTGIAQVRYQLDADGKLKALDAIPNQ